MSRLSCPYFLREECRSCSWIEQEVSVQLEAKQQKVRELLDPGEEVLWLPPAPSPVSGFRNRAKMSVTGTLERPVIGIIGGISGDSMLDEGQDLSECPVHHPRLTGLFRAMPDFIRRYRLTPYRISERTGELKALIAFYSPGSREMYLRFVLRSKEASFRIRKGIPELHQLFPDLACITANIQPIPHAILEGEEELFLTDRKTIHHQLGAGLGRDSIRLKLSPRAFVQTNAAVAAELYATAADWIALARPTRMVELYCGQGAFSFFASKHASQILGIEINAEAIRTANENARELGLSNLKFQAADATRVDAELQSFAPELLLVNPPRRGLGEGIELIRRHRPRDFIYSSCSIESLTRDLRALRDEYRFERIRLFDMFPHTEHFETLVWLKSI